MRLPILIFTGLFLFEPFYFVLSSSDLPVPDLPLGVLFGLATFALSYRYIKQPHYILPLLLIFFSMVAVYISARRSEWFDYEWILLFAWYLSKFILGYAVARDLTQIGWKSDLIVFATIAFSVGIWALMSFGEAQYFNYLRPSSSLLYAGTLALFCARCRLQQVLVYVVVAAALISLSSRTYAYLWLLTPFIIWAATRVLVGRIQRRAVVGSAAVGGVFVAAAAAVSLMSILPQELVPARLTPEVAFDESGLSIADNSINLRVLSIQLGWQQIQENVLTGYYNGFLEYGGEGDYIHGVLSYWHQYGLIPFLSLCLALAYLAGKVFTSSFKPISAITGTVLALTMLAVVLSRSYTETNLFWAIGFCLAALSYRGRIHLSAQATISSPSSRA